MDVKKIVDSFSSKKIAVIGDVMADRYIFGRVDRISPEAPIPIVEWQDTMVVPGGAGNTAANIAAMGAQCHLIGVVGDDKPADDLRVVFQECGIDIEGLIADDRPTTEKTRILGNHQQMLRVDHESKTQINEELAQQLSDKLEQIKDGLDAILICDYAKGVICDSLVETARQIGHELNIPVLADIKPQHKNLFGHISFLTPNRKELSAMTNHPVQTLEDVKEYGLKLAQELETNILVTLSEEGMMLIDRESGSATHLPTKAKEVVDVSGAGDTVIATATLCLAAGAEPVEAATIANHAASVVVSKLGAATLSPQELLATFSEE